MTEEINNIEINKDEVDYYCSINPILIEYYLIDKNGSYLVIDENNVRYNFVIHTDKSLENFINEIEGEVKAKEYLNDIVARRKIPFFGIDRESWKVDVEHWKSYFLEANTLNGRENYYWNTSRVNIS